MVNRIRMTRGFVDPVRSGRRFDIKKALNLAPFLHYKHLEPFFCCLDFSSDRE
jgi:hypothetical protein